MIVYLLRTYVRIDVRACICLCEMYMCVNPHMYVCMYVSMCVRVYVCMYVCTYVCMCVRVYA